MKNERSPSFKYPFQYRNERARHNLSEKIGAVRKRKRTQSQPRLRGPDRQGRARVVVYHKGVPLVEHSSFAAEL
jgi:hypothetical protein